jgi:hypothetical protein
VVDSPAKGRVAFRQAWLYLIFRDRGPGGVMTAGLPPRSAARWRIMATEVERVKGESAEVQKF